MIRDPKQSIYKPNKPSVCLELVILDFNNFILVCDLVCRRQNRLYRQNGVYKEFRETFKEFCEEFNHGYIKFFEDITELKGKNCKDLECHEFDGFTGKYIISPDSEY